jgi:SnoaL-like domain
MMKSSTLTLSYADERLARGDLYSRCAHDLDELDSDAWTDCFTEEAVFNSPRFGRFSGRKGLLELADLRRKALLDAKIRHFKSNLLVSIEGTQATAKCYLCEYQTKFKKTKLVAVGGYRDTLRKVEGRWLFQSREEFFDR